MMAAEAILIVEDEEHIGGSLLRALTGSGYDATWARTGAEALASVRRARPDLVLLDLGLPDRDGLDVCRQLHHDDASLLIMMLTARDEELDVVVGLDAGAVDYIAKPFKLAELLARIRAQLRRVEPSGGGMSVAGELQVDEGARRAWIADEEIELRVKEFDLLARLVADAGIVVTRESLMADVWDAHWHGSTKTLDFHIAALRRKIDPVDGPSRITTLRGVGYRLEAP